MDRLLVAELHNRDGFGTAPNETRPDPPGCPRAPRHATPRVGHLLLWKRKRNKMTKKNGEGRAGGGGGAKM